MSPHASASAIASTALVLQATAGAAQLGLPPAPDAGGDAVRFERLMQRDRFQEDGRSERTSEIRVELRDSTAVSLFGQLAAPYVDGFGEVLFDQVSIAKPDGRRVEVRGARIEDIDPFGVTGTFLAADIRLKRMTIPGLEPGDRLSYRIVQRSRPLVPGQIFGEAKLMPVAGNPVQTYELDLPRKNEITVRLREGLGAEWQQVPASADRIVRRLELRLKAPTTHSNTQLGSVDAANWSEPDVSFTSFRSWREVTAWWWELAKDRMRADEASLRAQAVQLVAGQATPRAKLEALHRFVASGIRYLNVSFGIGRMQPRAASEVLANRYGDCKDKHALLAALGKAAGIEVRPALIHTVRKDFSDDAPGPQQFDHMISVARLGSEPEDWVWIDSTNAFGLLGYLDPSLRDKRALLVEANGDARLVRTPVDPPFEVQTDVELLGALDTDGQLSGSAVWTLRSDEEVRFRQAFAVLPRDRHVEFVKASLAKDWKSGKVTRVATSDPADLTTPFRIEFDVERTVGGRREDREWELWVPLPELELPASGRAMQGNATTPQLQIERFGVRAEIGLPEGALADAPLSITLERPFGRFSSSYKVDGRMLKLERRIDILHKSVQEAEMPAYDSFRQAVETDRNQVFRVRGGVSLTGAALAESLHDQGEEAFQRKDYGKAVDLFRKAVETDPKVENGWYDLGRALRNAGQPDQALEAFTRQIQQRPFHEVAYADRAFTLIELGRWDEAEQDLLKQIEVAPFRAWSYAKLGDRRMKQRLFAQAVEYYSRATAIEPKEARHWVNLARAHARTGNSSEARDALDRARTLELPVLLKVTAATVYDMLGDAAPAGTLAESALPSLAEQLAQLSAERYDEDDLDWTDDIGDAWYMVGRAALAAGDLDKADRYLESAWRLVFHPGAALELAQARERRGKQNEAAQLRALAAVVAGATSAGARGPGSGDQDDIRQRLMELRVVPLAGPVLADFTEEVLLFVGLDGRVEDVRNLSNRHGRALHDQLRRLGTFSVPFLRPDDRLLKAVRRGLITCYRATGCSLVLDLPGTGAISRAR